MRWQVPLVTPLLAARHCAAVSKAHSRFPESPVLRHHARDVWANEGETVAVTATKTAPTANRLLKAFMRFFLSWLSLLAGAKYGRAPRYE